MHSRVLLHNTPGRIPGVRRHDLANRGLRPVDRSGRGARDVLNRGSGSSKVRGEPLV